MARPNRRRITGTTWDVYLCLVTSESPQGVRDIWRALRLSSPSLAQYHVNKLLELELIEVAPNGKYSVNEVERVGVLRSFVLLRGKLVPRLVFFGALVLGVLLAYLVFWPFRWDFRDFTIIIVSVFSCGAFFIEAYNQYKGVVHRS